jgi:hypothetical protein
MDRMSAEGKRRRDAEIARRSPRANHNAIDAAVGMSRSGVRMALRRLGLGEGGKA